MAQEIDQVKQMLREHGQQVTKARLELFRLLLSPEPQTVNQVLANAAGSIDRVSVYRNLALFERLGIIHRIYAGWKYKVELTDAFTHHHHHLTCLSCGQSVDIVDERHIDAFIAKVSADAGFTPRRHQFEVDGYCRDCAASR